MPFSHSHSHFMRKLSVQPEESGNEMDSNEQDGEGKETSGTDAAVMPLSFHTTPVFTCGPTDNDGDDDISYLRKLSVASISSIKSTNSVSSTCSAPGGMNHGIAESCNFPSRKEELFDLKPMSRRLMTSRPSFISLCSIVSETSDVPLKLLPAPLQVELDLMQRTGPEGDQPKCRSHLPILRCPSDYDINEMNNKDGRSFFRVNSKKSLVSGIKQFPNRIRKLSADSNRFDLYSISDQTREQLKRLYVY